MGAGSRCTYFLLANGCVTRFTRFGSSPSQKLTGLSAGIGCRSALCEAEAVAGCAFELDVCCANPGSASAAHRNMGRTIRFFIFDFLLPSGTGGSTPARWESRLTYRLCL